jgi:hypothetical protein
MSNKSPTLDYHSQRVPASDSRLSRALWLLASSATLIIPLLALACWVSRLKIGGR